MADAMTPDTPRTPRTPSTDDVETGHSPIPLRNDRADADASAQRKRPRLDSGERLDSGSPLESLVPLRSPYPPRTPPPPSSAVVAPLEGTPSRVTINVRRPARHLSPDGTDGRDGSPDVVLVQTHPQSPSTAEPITDNIAVNGEMENSSALSSPVIEAAEPEDILPAHAAVTGGAISDFELAQMFYAEFPLWTHGEVLEDTLERIQNHLVDNDTGSGHVVLRAVVEWIEKYLELTEGLGSKYFDIHAEQREFWDAVPHFVSTVLTKSPVFFHLSQMGRGLNGQDPAIDLVGFFLKAFARLVARTLVMDIRTLQDNSHESSTQPDLLSPEYLNFFAYSVRNQDAELLVNVPRLMSIAASTIMHNCMDIFTSKLPEDFNSLTKHTLELLARPTLEDNALLSCIETVIALVLDWSQRSQEAVTNATRLHHVRVFASTYFEAVNDRFQELVRKQSPLLRLENLKSINRSLATLLTESVGSLLIPFIKHMPNNYEPDSDTLEPGYRAYLTTASWKMMVYKECIMRGHMDARIFGVNEMNDLLLEAHDRYHKGRGAGDSIDPIIQFLGDFIHQHEIIHYLIGVDSHRQLVSRTKNIVIFLGASKQYENRDTDTLWNAVCEGQDPRVVEMIVHLVKELIGWCDKHQVDHYLNKFLELSVDAFNAQVRELCYSVIGRLLDLCKRDGVPMKMIMDSYTLFVRLSQEVYIDAKLNVLQKREIRFFAHNQLRNLIAANLPDIDLKTILVDCFNEISSASLKACGSAPVVCIVLGLASGPPQLVRLQKDFNFAEEAIKDLTRLRQMETQLQVSLNDFPETVTDRLTLITKFIVMVPSAFTEDLVADMWKGLVGEHALNDTFRNAAWALLSEAISHCGSEQQFLIDQILCKHFPSLEPSFLTSGVLNFAERATEYQIQMAQTGQHTPAGHAFQSGDLFWSIALKTMSSEIATTSIDRLVHHRLDAATMLQPESGNMRVYPHAAFVDRTIQTLLSAAQEFSLNHSNGGFRNGNIAENSSPQGISVYAKRRGLASLAILLRFVEQARRKTIASPQADSVKSNGTSDQPGDRAKIRFQAHAAGKCFEKAEIKVGDLATVRDLTHVLSTKTGFRKMNVIVGGKRLDLSSQADKVLREIPLLFTSLVLVQKLPSDKIEDAAPHTRLSPLDEEVMKHFHALYDLLDVDNEFGNGIYSFLTMFPPHGDIVAQVCNLEASDTGALPVRSTFKCLYCLYALHTNITRIIQEGLPCANIIGHGVQLTSSAILSVEPDESGNASLQHPTMLNGLVTALVSLLKEPVPNEVSASYFSQPEALVDCLTTFLIAALESKSPLDLIRFIEHCFMAILETTLHSPALRSRRIFRSEYASLIKTMLLENPYVMIRQTAKRSLESLLGALSRLPSEEVERTYALLWESLNLWIPEACQQPHLAEQFFTFTVGIFRNLSDSIRAKLPLNTYAAQWSTILGEHRHVEFVGRRTIDHAVYGVATLLRDCMNKGGTESSCVCMSDEVVEQIFRNLLFPTISLETQDPTSPERMPILDIDTRGLLNVILLKGIDMRRLQRLVNLSTKLFDICPSSASWSWGLAQPLPGSDNLESNRAFDRAHAIRSPTGYPGLRNLSNTCYMNALLTQLFMNRDFRNFMLNLHLAKPHTSQKLVHEMQRIFVFLQQSWLHAVDPECVAETLVTYDGTAIDVTVQMDVDEFYNLLFDRLENQMPNDKDKWALRRFYGGSIVQQIKSKDCPHVSERVEPFQAIQCEILGKSTLEESLKAYVEGEIMEGDNKYSCSSCGQYVNAVKRACLKDVPENLIFHLKRFDYDLATGIRSKINDYFQFPAEIDMGPFKIDYLKDPSIPATSDRFSLVGVLVHTGQAESGHYYSYVRDRSEGSDTWLEFNDSEVTYFDLKMMQSSSFGGLADGYDNEPFLKPWNAYMLFYQRTDSLVNTPKQEQCSERAGYACPSLELSNQIRIENELFLRKYSMFDDAHGFFVTALLENYISLKTPMACSDSHGLEKQMYGFALEYMDQVFARQKDSRHALPVLQALRRMTEGCGDCAKALLMWLVAHNDGFQNLLLKCPMEKERRAVVELIAHAVRAVQESVSLSAASLSMGDEPESTSPAASLNSIVLLCKALASMLPSLHLYHRGWDNYFGLLCDIAALGSFERNQLRSCGILRHVLQMLAALSGPCCARLWSSFQPLLKTMERRHFSFRKIIILTECLIREAEQVSDASSSEEESPNYKGATGLDADESFVLSAKTKKDPNATLAVLHSVFCQTLAEPKLSEQFVATLLHTPVGEECLLNIVATILDCRTIDPAANAEPWLRGAVGFIENTDDTRFIRIILRNIAQDASTLQDSGGLIYLTFFDRIRRAHNPILMVQDPSVFKKLILQLLPKFGPALLLYRQAEVRMRTMRFLQAIIREGQQVDDEDYTVQCQRSALALCNTCILTIESYAQKRIQIDVRRIDSMQQMLRYFVTDIITAEGTDLDDDFIADIITRVQGAIDTLEAIATSSPEELLTGDEDDDESDSGVTEYSRDETLG